MEKENIKEIVEEMEKIFRNFADKYEIPDKELKRFIIHYNKPIVSELIHNLFDMGTGGNDE